MASEAVVILASGDALSTLSMAERSELQHAKDQEDDRIECVLCTVRDELMHEIASTPNSTNKRITRQSRKRRRILNWGKGRLESRSAHPKPPKK